MFALTWWMFFGHALAAILYERATIIALRRHNSTSTSLRDASILIENDRITQLSEDSSSIKVPPNTTHIDATDKILNPGFVDTHHHLWQTAYKTIASNTTLPEYYQRYGEFSQAIQYFSPDDSYLGQLMGILELLYEGTTTVLDNAHASWSDATVDATANATFDNGIRAFYAIAFHDVPNNYTWEDQVSTLKKLANEPRFQGENGIVKLGLAYDSFFLRSC